MTAEEKQSCSVPGCDFDKTGVCGVHKYEVERRKDTEANAKEREARVQKIDLKLNWVLGFLTIISLVVGGNFTYARIVDQGSSVGDADLKKEITLVVKTVNTLAQTVNTLATSIAVHQATSEGKQRLIEQELSTLKSLNGLLHPTPNWDSSPGGTE